MEIPDRNKPLYPFTHTDVCCVCCWQLHKVDSIKEFLAPSPGLTPEHVSQIYRGTGYPLDWSRSTLQSHALCCYTASSWDKFPCESIRAAIYLQTKNGICKTTVTAECTSQMRKDSVFLLHSSCSFKSCLFPALCLSQGNWGSLRAPIRNIIHDP